MNQNERNGYQKSTYGDYRTIERDDALPIQRVDEAYDKRGLGADNDHVGARRLRPCHDAGDVVGLEIDVRRNVRRAGVAGRAEYLVALLVLRKTPSRSSSNSRQNNLTG